jgi:hypothetical protein
LLAHCCPLGGGKCVGPLLVKGLPSSGNGNGRVGCFAADLRVDAVTVGLVCFFSTLVIL